MYSRAGNCQALQVRGMLLLPNPETLNPELDSRNPKTSRAMALHPKTQNLNFKPNRVRGEAGRAAASPSQLL